MSDQSAQPANMRPQRPPDQRITDFLRDIQSLYETNRGHVAALKRSAGSPLSQARRLEWLHYYLIKHFGPQGDRQDNTAALVAGLMCLDRDQMRTGLSHSDHDLGRSLAQAAGGPINKPGNTPLERRLTSLLDSSFDETGSGEMAFRLRQAVLFILSKRGRISWPRLLQDVRNWERPNKTVQKSWARSFYGASLQNEVNDKSGTDQSDPNEGGAV